MNVYTKEAVYRRLLTEKYGGGVDGRIPVWRFEDVVVDGKKRPFDLRDHIRTRKEGRQTVAEFIGTGDFAKQFVERQRFEVEVGRDEEPLLYQPVYATVEDRNLPQVIPVYESGPGAVIFEEVMEGGEVKFSTMGQGEYSVRIRHYATGIEYDKDLVEFNQTWRLSTLERQVGRAFNALLNHIHFNPILAYAYASGNQTAASSEGTTLIEKYLRTLENALVHGENDNTNRREGPYVLLVASNNRFMVERMLTGVQQQNVATQSSAIESVRQVIVYNGWTGTRGQKTVSYAGVTSGKAYLISLGRQTEDFQSYVKQPLESTQGDGDISRFILEQIVYDTYFGAYANPVRAVEEITWPTS